MDSCAVVTAECILIGEAFILERWAGPERRVVVRVEEACKAKASGWAGKAQMLVTSELEPRSGALAQTDILCVCVCACVCVCVCE